MHLENRFDVKHGSLLLFSFLLKRLIYRYLYLCTFYYYFLPVRLGYFLDTILCHGWILCTVNQWGKSRCLHTQQITIHHHIYCYVFHDEVALVHLLPEVV